jgi:hypothetical protein
MRLTVVHRVQARCRFTDTAVDDIDARQDSCSEDSTPSTVFRPLQVVERRACSKMAAQVDSSKR